MTWISATWNLPIIKISGEGVFETKDNCDRLNEAFTGRHDKNCVIIFEGMDYMSPTTPNPSGNTLYSPCSELIQHLISKGYYVYAFVSSPSTPNGWTGGPCYFSQVDDPYETTTKLMIVEYNLGNFRSTRLTVDKYRKMSTDNPTFTFTMFNMNLTQSTPLDMSGDIGNQLGDNYICVINKSPITGGGLTAGGGSVATFRTRQAADRARKGSKQTKVSLLQQQKGSVAAQLAPVTSTVPLGASKIGATDAFSASLQNLSPLPPPPSGQPPGPPPAGTGFGGTVRRKPTSRLTRRVR